MKLAHFGRLLVFLLAGVIAAPVIFEFNPALAQQKKKPKKVTKKKAAGKPGATAKTIKKYKPAKIGLPWQKWKSTENKDHILVGRIWSKTHGNYISPFFLANQLATKDHVLIGEVHDNVDHHLLQAWLVRRISTYDRKPAIVMEMISQDQEPALTSYTENFNAPPENLDKAIRWSTSGWPAWENYLPIVQMAYAARLPIVAGNGKKSLIRSIGKDGFDILGYEGKQKLRLDQDLEKELEDSLRSELKSSHCGLIPDSALENMSKVQQYRDAIMADQMISHGDQRGSILIAGNGHVRTDRGVPVHIQRKRSDSLVASVMLVEARGNSNYPEDLVPLDPDGKPVADFIWITPAHKRPDQCEQMKKHFQHKKS